MKSSSGCIFTDLIFTDLIYSMLFICCLKTFIIIYLISLNMRNTNDDLLKYAYMSMHDTLKQMNSSKDGLTNDEAERRKRIYGTNEIKRTKGPNVFKLLTDQFINPLVLMLIFAAIITYLTGDASDTILIMIIVILNAWLGFSQEFHAEKIVEALKEFASPHAIVIRRIRKSQTKQTHEKEKYEQVIQEIDAREIVPGDIIVLEAGRVVPADARVIESNGLEVSESILTGESVSVSKQTKPVDKDIHTLGDMSSMVFSGTYVIKGCGKAVVVGTGNNTQIGRIASMTTEIKREIPLSKNIEDLTKQLSILIIVIIAIIFITGSLEGRDIIEMFKIAVGLGVAAVPEGLPAIVTITLAIGLKTIARKKAIVKSLLSVETLGRTNVIYVDKTGTLTKNEMTVTKIYLDGNVIDVKGAGYSLNGEFKMKNKSNENKNDLKKLLLIGYYCNNSTYYSGSFSGDPTEIALKVSALKYFRSLHIKMPKRHRINSKEFDSKRMLMSVVCETKTGYIQYTKGAPNRIIKRCDRILDNGKVRKINKDDIKRIEEFDNLFSNQALRVLGFAYKPLKNKSINEKEMIFVGLQGMIDPPREHIKDTIDKAKKAGIGVKMITGDHKETAIAVGRLIGIDGKALTGKEIDKLSDKELEKKIDDVDIFARVSPSHKLRIVKLLENKYIVAMTGDGVNDAPALKRASIGIAVKGASDVAKEAADMLLLEPHFNAIITAIEQGRAIYENIQKFTAYLLSCNLAEIAVIFIAIMLNMPLPLTIVQLLWINLVTDGPPAIILGMDPPRKDIMQQKPRNKNKPILTKGLLYSTFIISMILTFALLSLFYHYLPDETKARTVVFTGFVLFELARLDFIRREYGQDWSTNKKLILVIALIIMLQISIISFPITRRWFNVSLLNITDYLIIITTGIIMYLIFIAVDKIKDRMIESDFKIIKVLKKHL